MSDTRVHLDLTYTESILAAWGAGGFVIPTKCWIGAGVVAPAGLLALRIR